MDNYNVWLERAKSNLALADIKKTKGILFEDLCFQAQQAVEKGLKALLLFYGREPERTHNLVSLLQEVSKHTKIPAAIKNVVILNDYAMQMRYPGDYLPIKRQEYQKAMQIAKNCLRWLEYKLMAEKNKA